MYLFCSCGHVNNTNYKKNIDVIKTKCKSFGLSSCINIIVEIICLSLNIDIIQYQCIITVLRKL